MKNPPELKPLFLERMKLIFPKEEDYNEFIQCLETEPNRSIRCNTLKISPKDLKVRLEKKGWKISQPFKEYEEIMIVDSDLAPGELGRSLEHMLGYYYVQEICSMLPVLTLSPKPGEKVLDLCASPGSKTTQIAARMENKGTIVANEMDFGRVKILASNAERCGVSNVIITKKEGTALCNRLAEEEFEFDKILIDAPCSGEGTLRSTPKTARMWNIHTVRKLSKIQKHLVEAALPILKVGGTLVYSTCTHSPEENEEVVSFILEEFGDKMEIHKISLPLKCRPGMTSWKDEKYDKDVSKACRIYPQDNNTDGFFISKFKRVK